MSVVRVGVGVIVVKNGKFVMLHRSGDHGKGTWGLPGGHLEIGEKIFECASRETLEETGINVKNLKVCYISNDYFQESGKHYITIFLIGDYESGELTLAEPDKFSEIKWFDQKDLPSNMFLPMINFLNSGIEIADYLNNGEGINIDENIIR